MEGFQLLQLPELAIQDIVQSFTMMELLDLSQLSKKMGRAVRLCGLSRQKISLNFGTRYISMGKHKVYVWQIKRDEKPPSDKFCCFGEFSVPTREWNNNPFFLETFWDDKYAGLAHVGFHLATTFGCAINEFFSDKMSYDLFLMVIQTLIDMRFTLERMKIDVADLKETDLDRILSNIQIRQELWISSKLQPPFQCHFQNEPNMVRFESSAWFTLENLVSINCVRIDLDDSELSNEDVDAYLKKWKAGEFKNLVFLKIRSKKFTSRMPILGMMPPIEDKLAQNNRTKLIGKHYAVRDPKGVEIKANDGTVATISLFMEDDMPTFRLAVWN